VETKRAHTHLIGARTGLVNLNTVRIEHVLENAFECRVADTASNIFCVMLERNA
jgi:hypothetical protein